MPKLAMQLGRLPAELQTNALEIAQQFRVSIITVSWCMAIKMICHFPVLINIRPTSNGLKVRIRVIVRNRLASSIWRYN